MRPASTGKLIATHGSAECAVGGDVIQGVLESRELPIGELRDAVPCLRYVRA